MKLNAQIAALAAVIVATPAFAQIKINDSLSVTGWATGSYQYTSPSPGTSYDSINLDAAMLTATITPPKTPITATFSGYYRPSSEGGVSPGGSEFTLLDAYITYAASPSINITAGKFLSFLGYESFYLDLDNMISLANQQFLAPIPGYHEGINVTDQIDKVNSVGVAVVDSLFQKPGYNATEGDGEFKHSAGFEGYYTYNNTASGGNGLQIWAGFGYETPVKPGQDTSGVVDPAGHDVAVFDVWASYAVDKNNDTIALEEIYKDGGMGDKGSNWLAYFQYNINAKSYAWFCVSGEDVSDGPSYVRGSIAPTYNLTANVAVRFQYSYTGYSSYAVNNANYVGVETILKF